MPITQYSPFKTIHNPHSCKPLIIWGPVTFSGRDFIVARVRILRRQQCEVSRLTAHSYLHYATVLVWSTGADEGTEILCRWRRSPSYVDSDTGDATLYIDNCHIVIILILFPPKALCCDGSSNHLRFTYSKFRIPSIAFTRNWIMGRLVNLISCD